MIFYKKPNIEDERITNIKNKIYAEMYILIILICVISSIMKHYIFDLGIENIATELIILIISGVYYVYRSTSLGIFSAEVEMHDSKSKWSQRKKNLLASVVLGIGISLFFGINSAVQYAEGLGQSIYYFFLTSTVSLIIYLPFFLIMFVVVNDVIIKKSDKVMNKILDDDEAGEDDEKY